MPHEEEKKIYIELVDLDNKIQRMIDNQEKMATDIAKIKDAVYDPDEGIYARIRELESWKRTSSKVIWLIVTSMVGLAVATVWSSLITN